MQIRKYKQGCSLFNYHLCSRAIPEEPLMTQHTQTAIMQPVAAASPEGYKQPAVWTAVTKKAPSPNTHTKKKYGRWSNLDHSRKDTQKGTHLRKEKNNKNNNAIIKRSRSEETISLFLNIVLKWSVSFLAFSFYPVVAKNRIWRNVRNSHTLHEKYMKKRLLRIWPGMKFITHFFQSNEVITNLFQDVCKPQLLWQTHRDRFQFLWSMSTHIFYFDRCSTKLLLIDYFNPNVGNSPFEARLHNILSGFHGIVDRHEWF